MRKGIIFIIFATIILSCNNKPKSGSKTVDGGKIYKQTCMVCHGIDGKLGVQGSKDLTKSTLSLAEREVIIKNGKGAMTPMAGILSPEEIKAVAAYTLKLKE